MDKQDKTAYAVIIGFFILAILFAFWGAFQADAAQPVFTTFQGGTGTSSPSGILYGNGTISLQTTIIGSGLSFSGGTLSATGGASGNPDVILKVVGNTTYLAASTTANSWYFDQGFVSVASSTFSSNLRVTGDVSASSTLRVGGLATLGSGFIANASSTVSGGLNVTNGTLLASTSAFTDVNMVNATSTNATSTRFYTTTLGTNSEYFTDLTGTGLQNTAGSLNVIYGGSAGQAAQGNTTLTGATAGNGLTGGGGVIAVGTGGTFTTLNVGAGTGITVNADDIAVNYGAIAGTAVQGNTTVVCPTGTAGLAGGGNTITLGSGGTCTTLTLQSLGAGLSKWATSTDNNSIYPNGLVGILVNNASSTITNLLTVNATSTSATTTSFWARTIQVQGNSTDLDIGTDLGSDSLTIGIPDVISSVAAGALSIQGGAGFSPASGAGTAGTNVSFTAGAGGNAAGTGGANGGNPGKFSGVSARGGNGAANTGIGGNGGNGIQGGDVPMTGGNGGNGGNSSSGTGGAPGKGGSFTFQGGTAGTTGTGGNKAGANGGGATFTMGNGSKGVGSGADGVDGQFFIKAGSALSTDPIFGIRDSASKNWFGFATTTGFSVYGAASANSKVFNITVGGSAMASTSMSVATNTLAAFALNVQGDSLISGTSTVGAEIATSSLQVGQDGKSIKKIYTGGATLDFGSLVSIGCEDLTVTATGAATGDTVALGVPNASVPSATFFYTSWVSSADTVTIRGCTLVSGDPASGFFNVTVFRN